MNTMIKYFTAERQESLLFMLVGATALAVGVYFLMKMKQPFFTGMAYPLMVVALIQLTVGTTVYLRSPKDIVRVEHIMAKEPARIASEEIPRMHVVMKNFVIYRYVEMFLLLTGIGLALWMAPHTLWKGVGVGLAIQAAFMLLLDFFAEQRGKHYLEYLQQLSS